MVAHIQRVSQCVLAINGQEFSRIGPGFLVLLGISVEDTPSDAHVLASKIVRLRILADEEGKMNRSIRDLDQEIMVVSQFTLMADTRKGNRPSFLGAARPTEAIPLYEGFIKSLEAELGKPVATGVFGADMQITLTNDGPVTLLLDSRTWNS